MSLPCQSNKMWDPMTWEHGVQKFKFFDYARS